MSLRRALVVDDSRLARIALKRQLEAYDLSVDLADSGEEALEFLQHNTVDAIFMDHVMPGMNGLDAVRALKSNPRTATVPVMMYTSKEGELYVSQARALGAVDVLPKDVHSGQLFEMLLKLGLVRERRRGSEDDDAVEPAAHDDRREAGDEQPIGMPMHRVLTRMLEDQHAALRSEILSNQLAFARHVAREVHDLQKTDTVEAPVLPEPDTGPSPWWRAGGTWAAVLAGVCLVLGTLYLGARAERDAARAQANAWAAAINDLRREPAGGASAAAAATVAERQRLQADQTELYRTLMWALDESGAVPFGDAPFNALRAEQVRGLLARLGETGFRGTVRLESHLGEFCLVADVSGAYRLADPESPVSACTFIGHPLDDSSLLSERETPAFAEFMQQAAGSDETPIAVELVVHDRVRSIPRIPYPAQPLSAGHWNQVALRNNRVDFVLLPRRSGPE